MDINFNNPDLDLDEVLWVPDIDKKEWFYKWNFNKIISNFYKFIIKTRFYWIIYKPYLPIYLFCVF